MLVICNGAAKSGSTWLYNIVQNLMEFEWPDEKYISRSNTKHPTIKEKFLEKFVQTEDYVTSDIVSKNHYGKEFHRQALLADENTRIIDMSRDTRDVIVSSYYDSCRRNNYQGTFADYYWKEGRLLVDYMKRYHDVWDIEHPQILQTSFEALKTDFVNEVKKIAAFLQLDLTAEAIDELDKKTNIESLRKNYKDDQQYNTEKNPFFRKGAIGDWKNHFNDKMTYDYERIKANGIGKYDLIYLRNRIVEKVSALF
ncbi:MAG: sulfotransferase domain-containing protein [Colwellia sp.]|nr:sulfotransferase domain-containing protein [Colwellia sp.]